MAYSYVRYTGNGSTTNYTFSFPYINSSHIKVRLNGVLTTGFTLLNSSTIQFTSAPANGVVIEIRRETPKDTSIVNFTDGSVLLERDLDLLATYDLYLAQETKDGLDSTISLNSEGNFDAQGKFIINLAGFNDIDLYYLGPKSAPPTTDNQGAALQEGAYYWDSGSNQMFTWDGAFWKPTFVTGNTVRSLVVATAGQSLVTTPTYVVSNNSLQVYLNGVKQVVDADYTETSQSSITFASGLTVGDEVELIAFQAYPVGTTSAQNVSFQQPGTGAATRNVDLKLKEVISVKDFGATGDGVTDDTAAIQAALNYLPTVGFTGYQGATLYFPPGKYIISSMLKPVMADGIANIRLLGSGVTNTMIEWNGATDLTTGMFGLATADIGTLTNSEIANIRFKGKGKVGYIILFEATNTATGAVRRENENNIFRHCWFEGAKRSLVMFGKYSIDTLTALNADGNDINVNCNSFENCVFLNFENYAAKLVGFNVYNILFRNCFFWSGNNTDVNSANAKNYIFSVASGMTVVQAGSFMPLTNTGANNATDKVACLRGALADFHVYGAQTEESRVLYHNSEGDLTRPQGISGLYVNDSRAFTIGAWGIYNESASPVQVEGSSFGRLSGATDYYRHIFSEGAVTWNNSYTAKNLPTKMVLGTYASRSNFNGLPLDGSLAINPRWSLDGWNVDAATFRSATTTDYYLEGFFKGFGTAAEGTLTQQTSAAYNKTVPRLNCTVVGTSVGLRFGTRDKLDVTNYRGRTVWVLVAGQHNGSMSTSTDVSLGMFTDSSGGSGQDTIYSDGNYFVAWYKQVISSTATYIQPELRVKKVGYVELLNFMVIPDQPGLESYLYALAQYTRGASNKQLMMFEQRSLSEVNTSASQTYTDTLADFENSMYLVSANFNNAGSETAIVFAHRYGANAYASKVTSFNSGAGATITVSTSGAVVSIAVNGTSSAYVKKLKITQ